MKTGTVHFGWKSKRRSSLPGARVTRVADGIKRLTSVAVLLFVIPAGWADEPGVTSRIDFDIRQQRADLALTEFAEQADLTLVVPRDLLLDKQANALIGSYTLQDGVEILLAGTGLTPKFGKQIVLSITADATSVGGGKAMKTDKSKGVAVLIASVLTGGVGAQEAGIQQNEEKSPGKMDEIVVTGTNIRGAAPVGASVTILNRADIELSGVSDLPQLLRRIPQNFNGGITAQTQTGAGGAQGTAYSVGGTGFNLRGLGNDATLTLINGRRFAATGIGNFFDVSSIPLEAVERVEILNDGAAALYGADAVGGVVNIILKDDFDGATTTVRYGAVTDGGHDDFQVSQSLGWRWNRGGAFVSLQYTDRDPLFADERSFTQAADDPRSILPEQDNYSIYVGFDHFVADNIELFANLLATERDSELVYTVAGATNLSITNSRQASVAFGARTDIRESWQAEFSASFSRSDTSSSTVSPTSVLDNDIVSDGLVVEFKADGEIIDLPGGAAKLAVLGQFRREVFNDKLAFISSVPVDLDRDVVALSSEIYLPLVTDKNGRPGLRSLQLSIAGRIEEYSDFGTSTNPKIGVAYEPVKGIAVRSTFGTSFLAPQLFELNDFASFGLLLSGPDPLSESGTSVFYQRAGNSSQLKAEEADTWTVGLDFNPPALAGFNASLTYFNVEFDNRIDIPIGVFAVDALTRPDLVPFITRTPPQSVLDEIQAGRLLNFSGLPDAEAIASAVALLDSRLTNLAASRTDGVDFSFSYDLTSGLGDVSFTADGTYFFTWEEQVLPELPVNRILNTTYNPIDFNLRAGLSISNGGVVGGLFVNYRDDYTDTVFDPGATIDSFTTVDLSLSFSPEGAGLFAGLSLQLSVLNALDEDPPFVASGLGINYDGANGNPIGRFVSFELTKHW